MLTTLPLRSTAMLCCAAMLSACQSEPTTPSSVKFSAPAEILQVRAVNQDNLIPQVSLSDGTNIDMEQNTNGSWQGTINVQANNSYFVFVTWVEQLPEGDLVLAEWSRNVQVDEDGAQVFLGSNDYDFSADFDGDAISNINERENNTNPFVHNNLFADNNNDEQIDGEDSLANASDQNTTNNNTVQIAEVDGDTIKVSDDNDVDVDNDAGPDSDDVAIRDTDTNIDVNTDTEANVDANTNADTDTDTDIDVDTDTEAGISDDSENVNTDSSVSNATVVIPRIATRNAPLIDGVGVRLNPQGKLLGEWASAVQTDNDDNALLINRLMINNSSDSEDGAPLRSWAAMHDGTYLYVLVLSDDIGARQRDSENVWHDDSLELFIDADNSKLPIYGDADDFHYLIPLLQDPDNTGANNNEDGLLTLGLNSSSVNVNIEFHTGPGEGPDGIRFSNFEQDVYELAIPLAEAGIQVGQDVGFELQLNDDDDGKLRDSKWGWFHPSRQDGVDTDLTFTDPSVMGTVILAE